MKKIVFIFLITLSLTVFSADYIFFFLGDGMGINHLKLANEYSIKKYGKTLNYNSLENLSILNTESLDGVTDSAAAITSFMSFEKTNNNKINIDKDGNKLNPVSHHFKDTNYKQLDSRTIWKAKSETECNLGKWIIEQENIGKEYTKTENWAHLKEVHSNVHNGVQSVIEDNANGNVKNMLNTSLDIDKAISDVFWTIQKTKRENNE